MKYGKQEQSGFTLIEYLIGSALISVVVIITGLFVQNILSFGDIFQSSFESKSEMNHLGQAISQEIRAMTISNAGSYPIDTAASSTLIFYSDPERDGLVEKIRYFLDGNTLKKGILRPSGGEQVIEVVNNAIVASSNILNYYDASY